MKAIDLYSGIGGWTLGLRAAGIETVASYEWWTPANTTHERNLGAHTHEVDIRALPLEALPSGIDVVVGSPPCTQFSYANRGGNGDIADGLRDIAKFLEVVEHLSPRYWAMENVPRVAQVLDMELGPTGSLRRFAHLFDVIEVVDASDFGLPQRRRRMVAGRFPSTLLRSYTCHLHAPSLGDVVRALTMSVVHDPCWGFDVPLPEVTELEREPSLTLEEERMNRESKEHHPVYNRMAFPDPLDRTARTVTATCTRVSRESIVISDDRTDGVRRLSVRERACLQGFPISFQFYGKSHSDKLKMIGNAIPPVLTYYLGCAMQGIQAEAIVPALNLGVVAPMPSVAAPRTVPEASKGKHGANRRFRAAIPGLRFGSGTRFELANQFPNDRAIWNVRFYHGSSKDVRMIHPDSRVWDAVAQSGLRVELSAVRSQLSNSLTPTLRGMTSVGVQQAWVAGQSDGMHPHLLVDQLGAAAAVVESMLPPEFELVAGEGLLGVLHTLAAEPSPLERSRSDKLIGNARSITAGLLVAAWFNSTFDNDPCRAEHSPSDAAA